jgi:exopolyphosphatase
VGQLKTKLLPNNTRWILVDHNALQGELGKIYLQRVQGTIDHHEDEHKVSKDTGDEPRIIVKTGSCTSLVANYCRQSWDNLSSPAVSSSAGRAPVDADVDEAGQTSLWDAQVAKLAMASILIDTNNLDAEDKTTNHDKDAVEYLTTKIMSSPQASKDFDRTLFFEQISEAKRDIDSLSLSDILRKDYKEWTEDGVKLGVSSVVKATEFLVQKANAEANRSASKDTGAFQDAVKQFCEDRGVDLFGIMTTSASEEGKFQRELFLWALKGDSVAAAKQFELQATEELGLKPWTGPSQGLNEEGKDQWRKIWQQHEVQHSRKSIAPLLRVAMN